MANATETKKLSFITDQGSTLVTTRKALRWDAVALAGSAGRPAAPGPPELW
jgi:hypothetical protein